MCKNTHGDNLYKKRDSNIEILRIIAMIMIIVHHFELFAWVGNYSNIQISSFIHLILMSVGKLGVNIFVLISGYFLIKSKFSIKRILKLWLQIASYSIGIFTILKMFNIVNISWKEIIYYAFPISYRKYWFASTYMYLCLLSPYINKFVENIDKKMYKNLLILLTILFSIIYSFLYNSNSFINGIELFETVPWFIYLYLLAGYIRLYGIKLLEKNKNNLIIMCFSILVFIGFICIIYFINIKYGTLESIIVYYTKMNSIFILVLAITIFYAFKNMKIKHINIINNVSKVTFAVYLIHEHDMMRSFMWKAIRTNIMEYELNEFFILIITIIVLFIVAYLIEKIRVSIEELIFKNKKLNKACDKIDRYIYNLSMEEK